MYLSRKQIEQVIYDLREDKDADLYTLLDNLRFEGDDYFIFKLIDLDTLEYDACQHEKKSIDSLIRDHFEVNNKNNEAWAQT